MDYSTKSIDINYLRRLSSNIPEFAEDCLKILENLTLMLLSTSEKLNSEFKLNYCYCSFTTLRWKLNQSTYLHQNIIMQIAKSIIKRIQNLLYWPPENSSKITYQNSDKRRISSSLAKFRNKKSKHKSKNHKKLTKDCANIDHQKKMTIKRYGNLFYPVNHTESDFLYIIDQMYMQIRAVLSENCIDDVDILKEMSKSLKVDCLSKSITEKKRLLPINQYVNHVKYQEQLWSGDCKPISDSRDNFPEQLDNFLTSENLNIDVASLTDKIFTSRKSYQKNQYRKDWDLDEGFSEHEFLNDVDNGSSGSKYSDVLPNERFLYSGDCHYNSSNSKSDEIDSKETSVPHVDDGSDSDGGTELLNSVNDSLNKFNAFMQNTININENLQLEGKLPDFSSNVIEQTIVDKLWSGQYQTSSDTVGSHDNNSLLSLPNDKNESLLLDTISRVIDQIICKEERCELPKSTVSNVQQQPSIPNLSNFNSDMFSKLVVSPISRPNWCSYNFSQMTPTSCSFTYQTKLPVNVETNNISGFNSGKVSNWLPPISHGLVSTNSFIVGSNHHQQPQFHRIVLSPHLTIPSGNIGPIQHNIVHLPHLFHHVPHSILDSEYCDRLYIPTNQSPYQYSNPNNNNSSSEYLSIPATNLLSNSNSSNITLATNIHQPTSIIKTTLDKSQRACCFYMRGGCKKEDCEYAHDLSKVTCKFWEKGDCFKADTCPFKHGYAKD